MTQSLPEVVGDVSLKNKLLSDECTRLQDELRDNQVAYMCVRVYLTFFNLPRPAATATATATTATASRLRSQKLHIVLWACMWVW